MVKNSRKLAKFVNKFFPVSLNRHENMLISGYNNYFRISMVSPFI